MTWRSTAAASGLMVVATWLASHAPVGGPRERPANVPSPAQTETVAAEIQREAERLHDRLQQVAAYKLPTRNPFRFGAHPPRAAARQPTTVVEPPPAPVEPRPAAPAMTLSGIGEELAGEEVVRTAIVSTPTNVHIVKVGETIDGLYKVANITGDAVDLERVDDRSIIHLSLRR